MAPPKKKPVRSKSTVSKKRQSTLKFAPISSPATRHSNRITTNARSSSSRYDLLSNDSSTKSSPASTPKKDTTIEVVILTPRKQGKARKTPIPIDDTTEDEEPIQSSGKRRRPSRPVVLDDDDEDESDAIPVLRLHQRSRETPKDVTFALPVDGEGAIAEDSESDAAPRARRKRQTSPGEDDDDDIISPAAKRRRSSTHSQRQSKEQSLNLEYEDEAPSSTYVEPPESEVDPEIRPARVEGSDTDDLEILPPTKATEDDESGMGSDVELALQTRRHSKIQITDICLSDILP
jgi:hypothetical protein